MSPSVSGTRTVHTRAGQPGTSSGPAAGFAAQAVGRVKLPPQGPRSQRGAPGSAAERELFSSWQKPCFSTKPDPRAASPRKLSLPLPVLATSVVRSAVCCLQSLRALCAGSCTGSVNPGWWVTEARGQREGALSLLPLGAPQGLRLLQPCSPAQETPDPWPLPPFAC